VGRRGRIGFLDLLGILAQLFLGGMLLYAAILKAADPTLFIEQIRGYKLFPGLAPLGAYVMLWVEFILGGMMIWHVAPRWSLLGFAGLMLFFIGVTAWAWSRGNASDCGCFGRMAARPPKEVILEDLAYLALAAYAFWRAPWLGESRGRWMIYALTIPLFLALPWVAPLLPVDSLVTPVKAGYNLETLAAEDLKVPLGDGRVFLAFLGDNCSECVAALPMMAELTQRDGAPKVTGVFAGDRAHKRAWALDQLPAFPLANASEKTLRQYYRKLPVFLLLEEGAVRQVWWRRQPTVDEIMTLVSSPRQVRR
jgi:hypothetical protein